MAEFAPPSWTAPFDPDAFVASIPADMRVRGLFFRNLIGQLKEAGGELPQTSYVPFQFYPGRDYVRLLVDVAHARHPRLPLRQGLRRIGHTVYGTFLQSTIGRVLFAFAGRDPRAALRVAPRAYAIASGGTITARVYDDGPDRTILELQNVWTFPSCHEVGVLEGALQAFRSDAMIEIAEHSPGNVDFRVIWR